MAVISFSLRDEHPDDMKILEWYKGLSRSERSREIRSVILNYIGEYSRSKDLIKINKNDAHINNNRHTIDHSPLQKVNLARSNSENDIEGMLGGMGIEF
jgi:hypothetical protein